MTARTYFLETFGCQMNVLDSELVAGQLRSLGLEPAGSPRRADVVLFNTCSVRQHAEDKVLSRVGELKGLKRRRPGVVIGLLGCMAERVGEELFERAPHLDLLCGPGELDRLPELLQAAWHRRQRLAALAGVASRRTPVLARAVQDDRIEALDLSRRPGPDGSPYQAYIRVQRGCDKFCTYCIVPYVRGPERSRPPGNIVAEARRLADSGCREVTLLGQTVNSYAYPDDGRAVRFAELLERVHAIAGLDRIRFVTSFPADWDEDIFRVMRDCPRICPYLHLPAQSGSDRILKAMKRGYTTAQYLRLIDTARRYIPDIALAGDFIVGFCGEDEGDFQATVELVERVQYKSIFVFKYSPRPGTPADRNRADDVPADVKAARNNALLAVQRAISMRQKRALIGQAVDVLVEGYSKLARKRQIRAGDDPAELRADGEQGRGAEATPAAPQPPAGSRTGPAAGDPRAAAAPLRHQLVGRTPHDLIVVFEGGPEHIGGLVRVRVESASALTLSGRIETVLSPPRTRPRPAGVPLPVVEPGAVPPP